MGLDDDEPNLRDVIKILGTITTKLAAHDARMNDLASQADALAVTMEVQPGPSHNFSQPWVAVLVGQNQFNSMEEQVHR